MEKLILVVYVTELALLTLAGCVCVTIKSLKEIIKGVKADTVREFAERVKSICWGGIISTSQIDQIAKEIMEEEKK